GVGRGERDWSNCHDTSPARLICPAWNRVARDDGLAGGHLQTVKDNWRAPIVEIFYESFMRGTILPMETAPPENPPRNAVAPAPGAVSAAGPLPVRPPCDRGARSHARGWA